MPRKTLYSDLRLNEINQKPTVTDGESVLQSANTLMSTPKGSRFFRPELGVSLGENLFELNDRIQRIKIEDTVVNALRKDNRISIHPKDVRATSPSEHVVDVDVSFAIEGLDGDRFELVGDFDGSFPAVITPECRPFQGSAPAIPAKEDDPKVVFERTPEVIFTVNPDAGFTQLTTSFTVGIVNEDMANWRILFGDGSLPARSARQLSDGKTIDVPHTYQYSGIYTATLIWQDKRGETYEQAVKVTVVDLDCQCNIALTVLLEDETVAERVFFLIPVSMPGVTHKCPLVVDGLWDGETYIYLIDEPLTPPIDESIIELVTFYREGILTKAWALREGAVCPEITINPDDVPDPDDPDNPTTTPTMIPWNTTVTTKLNEFNQTFTAGVGDLVDIEVDMSTYHFLEKLTGLYPNMNFHSPDKNGEEDTGRELNVNYYDSDLVLPHSFNIPGLVWDPAQSRIYGTVHKEAKSGRFYITPTKGGAVFIIKFEIGGTKFAPSTQPVLAETITPTGSLVLKKGQEVDLTLWAAGVSVMGEPEGDAFFREQLDRHRQIFGEGDLDDNQRAWDAITAAWPDVDFNINDTDRYELWHYNLTYDRASGKLPQGLNYDPDTNKITGMVADDAQSGYFDVFQPVSGVRTDNVIEKGILATGYSTNLFGSVDGINEDAAQVRRFYYVIDNR